MNEFISAEDDVRARLQALVQQHSRERVSCPPG